MNNVLDALKYANNLYARLMLAVAATLYTIFTIFGPDPSTMTVVTNYPYLQVLPPYFKWQVVLIFGVDAILLWWRIFDDKPRVIIAKCINFFNAVLWIMVVLLSIFVYDELLTDNVGKILLAAASLHMLTRTDYTPRDRGSA